MILSLAVIAAIAAGVLSIVAYVTKDTRDQIVIENTIAAFKELQPDFDNEPLDGLIYLVRDGDGWKIEKPVPGDVTKGGLDTIILYPATKDGKLVTIFAQSVSNGYDGGVTVLFAMNPESGAVMNVVVTEHTETPGLGTQVFTRGTPKTIWGIFKGEYKEKTEGLEPNVILDFFNGKMYLPDSEYNPSDSNDIIPESKWKVEKDGGEFLYITGATITSRAVTKSVEKVLAAYHTDKEEILKTFESEK